MNLPRDTIVTKLLEEIDIPKNAYDKAESRYKSVTDWFKSDRSESSQYDPHLYPQGSFRLGTVIKPITPEAEYDLDMGCRLRRGITKITWTQAALKGLVGRDVEGYRKFAGIGQPKEEKHRCWRLRYADELKFHLDVVPSIPETAQVIRALLEQAGLGAALAQNIAQHTGAITDDRRHNYRQIHSAWPTSNSEGFAIWFESRMEQQVGLRDRLLLEARAAKVDRLPAYRWKTPLQRAVQLLKRHRDVSFLTDEDGKPASVIVTTLAARAYRGEGDVLLAVDGILSRMGSLVSSRSPRVPNPVNPEEDFADRWQQDPNLERKFRWWLDKAKRDFDVLGSGAPLESILEQIRVNYGASLDPRKLAPPLSASLLQGAVAPAGLSFPNKPVVPQKPSGFA